MLLELDLLPGVGLGPFVLGMPLNEAVKYIQSRKREFRCVELKYADKDILDHDLILNLPEHGLHLRFESGSQRLRLIEIYDNSRIQLRYGKRLLGGASHAATALLVYNLLGPTASGTLDMATRLYPVHYSGLLFLFPIPSHHTHHFLQSWGEIPLEFPDKTTPVAARICIYAGAAESPEDIASLPPPAPAKGSLSGSSVTAVLQEGLEFEGLGSRISFGDSPQDICSEIGAPSWTATKTSTPTRGRCSSRTADYFYCYANRGLDVLFDGVTHKAKKFVLRTNAPGHPEFNTYSKCHFNVRLPAPYDEAAQDHTNAAKEASDGSADSESAESPIRAPGRPTFDSWLPNNLESQGHLAVDPAQISTPERTAQNPKQSPRWQDASPRDPLSGAAQELQSGTSDASKDSFLRCPEDNELEATGDQRDGWGESDLEEAMLDLGFDKVPGVDRQSGSDRRSVSDRQSVTDATDGQSGSDKTELYKHTSSQQTLRTPSISTKSITCDSKFQDIQEVLGEMGLAGVQSRGIGCADPIARTIVHGYKGAAFEVMRNGYLASVTITKC